MWYSDSDDFAVTDWTPDTKREYQEFMDMKENRKKKPVTLERNVHNRRKDVEYNEKKLEFTTRVAKYQVTQRVLYDLPDDVSNTIIMSAGIDIRPKIVVRGTL